MRWIIALPVCAVSCALGAVAAGQDPSTPIPVARDSDGVHGTTMSIAGVATRTWADLVRADAEPVVAAPRPPVHLPVRHTAQYRELGAPPNPGHDASASDRDLATALPALISPWIPKLTTSFQALEDLGTAFLEPDATGAIGPDEIMVMLNDRVRIQDRNGGAISTIDTETFWAPTGSTFPIHATVRYDELADRWIACAAYPLVGDSQMLFAISSTSKASGAWTFYTFPSDPNGTSFANVTRMGFNSKWIAFTSNNFDDSFPTFIGAGMWVIDKASALVPGGPITVNAFYPGFDPDPVFHTTGESMVPATTHDPDEQTLWIIDSHGIVSNTMQAHRLSMITGTGSAPVWSQAPGGSFPGTGLYLVKQNYSPILPKASQFGTTARLVVGEPHIMDAVFRNGRLWYTHMGGTPFFGPYRTSTYWYEINPSAPLASPIVQFGLVDSETLNHIIPSIAVNRSNDMMLGFTRCGASIYPEAACAFRMASDIPGTTRPVQRIKAGDNSYDRPLFADYIPWGNRSATAVDPLDDRSMWTVQEYAAVPAGPPPNDPLRGDEDRWGTWWSKLAFRTLCPADIDGDGVVGTRDFNILARNFGTSVTPASDGDLNGDGVVDVKDFVLLASEFACGI